MDTPYARANAAGNKKHLVNRSNTTDNIYRHAISMAIADGSASDAGIFSKLVSDHMKTGANLHARDSRTGETYYHVLCKSIHHYMDAKTVRIFYDLGTKIDLDMQDHLGDTALHKICLVPGAWRCIVAVLRCGASPLIKNNMDFTPQELVLHHQCEALEENLYWLRKFYPGLWNIEKGSNPEMGSLAERFLKSWCRTSKVIGNHLVNLRVHCLVNHKEFICAVMMEHYEMTNELAMAMLGGSTEMVDTIISSDMSVKANVNCLDHSYQYKYQASPTAPRPLLLAVWETENYEMVKRLMALKPNTSFKYTFEADASSSPKPLFFHLVNPKSRPENPQITAAILQGSDLTLRNEKGETILFEAIYNNETSTVIQTILDCGVNIAARDLKGRTARDRCIMLERNDYRDLIDSHVVKLATDLDFAALENLVLQMYDHFPDECKVKTSQLPRCEGQLQILHILKNVQCAQVAIKKMFTFVKVGNFTQLWKTLSALSPQFAHARDKAGRSLLHYAVQSSASEYKNVIEDTNEEIMDEISTVSIDKNNQQVESVRDTVKLHSNTKDKRTCLLTELFCRKNTKQDFLSIVKHLVKEFPSITSLTNNLGQTALHTAFACSASKTILEVVDEAENHRQIEDIFGFVPKDYNRDLCGEQTYRSRRKPVDDMDLNIFLTESKFEHHLKKSIRTGQTCKLRCLINSLIAYGGEPYYNHFLFDCLDANRISLASYLIEKGFNANISKQVKEVANYLDSRYCTGDHYLYDACNPENPMCAMMECSHTVTTLRQRAEQVGATDLVSLISKRS